MATIKSQTQQHNPEWIDMSRWDFGALSDRWNLRQGWTELPSFVRLRSDYDPYAFASIPPGPHWFEMNVVGSGLGVDANGFPNQGRVEHLYLFSRQNLLLDFGGLDLAPTPLVAAFREGRTADVISMLTAGSDVIEGGNYNLQINFTEHGDVILGGQGDDTIIGHGGSDVLRGGGGDDLFSTRDSTTDPLFINARAEVDGGAGLNTVTYADAPMEVIIDLSGATVSADTLINVQRVVGSRFGDLLTGSSGSDTIRGGGGGDTITAGAGADWISSGRTLADPREALLWGGDGEDTIEGDAGFNRINGNAGNDMIVGRSQTGDWLLGGQGDDGISARDSTGGNIINGNLGRDTLAGSLGADTLRGGQGDDYIVAGAGADWLFGDLGSDTMQGGAGADTFFAGAGLDRIYDFNVDEGDRIRVEAGASAQVQFVGSDVVITLSGGHQTVLVNAKAGASADGWLLS